ncbi:MAG TPA: ribose-5-phosphate isomerase RpiA [Chitinophagaceae bacterium]|nr:ribose-5-phosphate isomerase RpiA [Chitinophagaceae bacterium]
MINKEEIKRLAAVQAMEQVRAGMTLGVGTGSTVYWFILELAKQVKQGLSVTCVPTSAATASLATQLGIRLVTLNEVSKLDLTIDGADEIDPQLCLIKGGGGALLQEKMVAAASDKLVIIADGSKKVQQLGRFPLPVEVIPYGWKQVQQHIAFTNDVVVLLRMKNDLPLITDHGHYILDCQFNAITDAAKLAVVLNTIPGVVENGLFINMASMAIIAHEDGSIETILAP